jgi:hypothetical protein
LTARWRRSSPASSPRRAKCSGHLGRSDRGQRARQGNAVCLARPVHGKYNGGAAHVARFSSPPILRCPSNTIRARSSSVSSAKAERSTLPLRLRARSRPQQPRQLTRAHHRPQTALGPGDRRKLDEYVESIRDVERRIEVLRTSSRESAG